VIIVDYAELVRPSYTMREKRHSLGQVVLELRGLAGEFDSVLYTAWQGNRESLKTTLIDEANLSESWEPAKHTDVLLTITPLEDEEEEAMLSSFMSDTPYYEHKLFIALSRISAHQKVTLTLRRNKMTGKIKILEEDVVI